MSRIRAIHRWGIPTLSTLRLVVVGLVATSAIAFAAPGVHDSSRPSEKPLAPAMPVSAQTVLVGGDNAGTAVVIPGIPYTDAGNTCSFNDDYVVTCAPGSSAAPDVVYRFTPTSTVCVNLSVCQSDYDAALYVWQTSVGNVIACNDDACGSTGQQSRIAGLTLQGGVTYYIVVDGFGTQPPFSVGCGNYELTVSECAQPCTPLACPPGAINEPEPTCATGYIDQANGGCNSSPPVFTNVACPATICGQYGKFCSDPFFCFSINRDTDWYRLDVPTALTLHLCVQGEIPTQIDVVDGGAGCPGTLVPSSLAFPLACETFCEDLFLAPGTYWIFVAPANDTNLYPCGSRYVLSLSSEGCSTTPAHRTTWGGLKTLYR